MKVPFHSFAVILCAMILASDATATEGPPTFLLQPTNAVAREGEQVAFVAHVDGTSPLIFQWWRNGMRLSNGTASTLLTTPLTLGENGAVYFLTVSNVLGAMTSADAFLTVTPGIIVSASANNSSEPLLYRGWPLLLEVALTHPDAFTSGAAPLLISAASGRWHNALQISIRNESGQSQTWPLHPAQSTNETIELNGASGARMLWWLNPVETAALPLGNFELIATLNTTNVTHPGAWKGVLRSAPIILSVAAAPSTLSEAQQEQKRRLSADYALLQGDPVAAQNEINGLLSAYPTNIGGLTYNIFLKQDAGLFDDAYRNLELALEQVGLQSPNAKEPPAELLAIHADLYPIVAPPVLQSTITGQQLFLSWSGYPLFSYRLEASSNLTAWSTFTTNFTVLTNRFSTTVPTEASFRFFRVVR